VLLLLFAVARRHGSAVSYWQCFVQYFLVHEIVVCWPPFRQHGTSISIVRTAAESQREGNFLPLLRHPFKSLLHACEMMN